MGLAAFIERRKFARERLIDTAALALDKDRFEIL
jgi:hypothetical protein